MAVLIRQALPGDALQWLGLFKAGFGDDYPDKLVYDLSWIKSQLEPASGCETWVAEAGQRLQASVSLLPPEDQVSNPIINLGRQLIPQAAYADGSAKALVDKINELADTRGHRVVTRVLASDNAQQALFENLGYICVGFQPFKHAHRIREGVLFYLRMGREESISRVPISESLPLISELSAFVLSHLHLPPPQLVRDGITGYPLQSNLKVREAPFQEFESSRLQSQSANPPVEVSSGYNLGAGLWRLDARTLCQTLIGSRDDRIVAGLAYIFDEQDRCVRVVDSFATDGLATGPLFQQVLKHAQETLHAVYVEVDVLVTAPRLLKTAEQLGFVPVAYLPAFFRQDSQCADVVKLVKLNMLYSPETAALTSQARSVAEIVDHNFQDQKVGMAIINLLRSLPIFTGLGEGELRKIARLFVQKLYRPGDIIFNQGAVGNEAYIVMRGQVDVMLPDHALPIATITNGQIFGEQAFLDGASRGATVRANQASILLVVQRSAFYELVQREPHLGMVCMRNIATELSQKLRRADALLTEARNKKP